MARATPAPALPLLLLLLSLGSTLGPATACSEEQGACSSTAGPDGSCTWGGGGDGGGEGGGQQQQQQQQQQPPQPPLELEAPPGAAALADQMERFGATLAALAGQVQTARQAAQAAQLAVQQGGRELEVLEAAYVRLYGGAPPLGACVPVGCLHVGSILRACRWLCCAQASPLLQAPTSVCKAYLRIGPCVCVLHTLRVALRMCAEED